MKKILLLFFLTSVVTGTFAVTLTGTDYEGKPITLEVDDNITELTFFKQNIKTIDGLEKLKNLKILSLEKMVYMNGDYTFLKNLPSLEVLIMWNMTITDSGFLKELSGLKALILMGVKIKTDVLDLHTNTNLEYLAITNSQLKTLPELMLPDHIEILNFRYNKLTEEVIHKHRSSLFKTRWLLIEGNPAWKELYKLDIIPPENLTNEIIPEKYSRFSL